MDRRPRTSSSLKQWSDREESNKSQASRCEEHRSDSNKESKCIHSLWIADHKKEQIYLWTGSQMVESLVVVFEASSAFYVILVREQELYL